MVSSGAAFEDACQSRRRHLFVLPPRSPMLNGAVERAQRTHTEKFYEICRLPNWMALNSSVGVL